MNNLKSYTEYAVTAPTTDFVIGFDFNYGTDAVNVTVDGVPATGAGYSVIYLNSTTMRLNPAVPTGAVRLQRETDIDVPDNRFTAGAKFIASNMDENFTQLRHAQQEVRDGFGKLSEDTYEIIDTLQVVGQAAQDAADAAEQAAQTANDAAAQVNDKVSYQDLDDAVDIAVQNTLTEGVSATVINDAGGKNQQEINDQSLYKDPADAIETLLSKSIAQSSYVNNIDVSLTLTVGASGQFSNLNSALEHATRLSFLYKKRGVWCDVLLLSGFIMDEQVLLNNTNLAHVRIKSQDTEVTIKRSALVLGQGSRFPAFGATNGAHLPFINAYFVMDETGTQAYRDGIYVSDNSLGVCHEGGVRNVGGRGLNVASGSMFDARNAVFKGAKEIGMRVSNASVCQARSCDFSNSYRGASINTGYVCLSYSNMSDCGIGISADEGSVLSFSYGVAERCTEQALLVDGAIVFAKGANLNGSAIGIYAKNSANVNFESGQSTGGNKAIYAESGAYVSAVSANLSNSSQIGAHITFGASAALTSADITGCGIGISADRGANVSAYGADMTGATTACVISRASTVTLEAAKARRNASADSIADIQVSHGGIVRKTTGTTGGNSQPSNIVTNSGIIFDATVRPTSGTTAARPTAGLYVGQQYFDTTLGKVIFVKDIAAPVWVDSAGTTV